MKTLSPNEIKSLLTQYGGDVNKFLGQNFLINSSVLEKIINAAELTSNDTIIEVGPGLGVLTQALLSKAKEVIAIEKDQLMITILEKTLANNNHLSIVRQDALQYQPPKKPYKIVANIPYYLTSALIRKFLESPEQPDTMVLMIQKEVAQRICEKPPRATLLSCAVQFYAQAKIISFVSRESFWPAPNVDSAIIKIDPHKDIPAVLPEDFFQVVKAGFSHPRKQLVNNLCILKSKNGVPLNKYMVSEWLSKNGIMPNQRAQTLSIEQWILLTKNLPNV